MRPTARGWQAIFFGGVSYLAARLIGTTQFYQLAYALAGLLLVALVLGLFLSRGLRYERRVRQGTRFAVGRTSGIDLAIHNASASRGPGVEVLDHLPERRLVKTPGSPGPSGTRVLREKVSFARRGAYFLGPAQLRTADPFGLLRFARRFEETTGVLVHPKVFDLDEFPTGARGSRRGVSGTRDGFAGLAGRGDEFSGLREYRRGDDRRHIHWKSVARTGEMVVKEFTDDAPQRRAVILDLRRPTPPPETPGVVQEVEDAISVAGSVLLRLGGGAASRGVPFRLICSDAARSATAFGAGEAAYLEAMDLLAGAKADGDANLGDLLVEELREERGGASLGEGGILITRSPLNDHLLDAVRNLRSAGLAVVIVALAVHTYREASPGKADEEAFTEGVRRLEEAGAEVRVVRRRGGVAALGAAAARRGGRKTRGTA